jgi:threonine aldolase
VCFSKGLGAPVGSALAGDADFCGRARRFRKMLGGGMRQAGVIASGALHALEHHRERLADDHANAKRLAQGLAELPGVEVDPGEVQTNIVIFRVTSMPAANLCAGVRERGVLVLPTSADHIRAVTNLMVSPEDIVPAVRAFREALKG